MIMPRNEWLSISLGECTHFGRGSATHTPLCNRFSHTLRAWLKVLWIHCNSPSIIVIILLSRRILPTAGLSSPSPSLWSSLSPQDVGEMPPLASPSCGFAPVQFRMEPRGGSLPSGKDHCRRLRSKIEEERVQGLDDNWITVEMTVAGICSLCSLCVFLHVFSDYISAILVLLTVSFDSLWSYLCPQLKWPLWMPPLALILSTHQHILIFRKISGVSGSKRSGLSLQDGSKSLLTGSDLSLMRCVFSGWTLMAFLKAVSLWPRVKEARILPTGIFGANSMARRAGIVENSRIGLLGKMIGLWRRGNGIRRSRKGIVQFSIICLIR